MGLGRWVLDSVTTIGAEGHTTWVVDEKTEFTTRLKAVVVKPKMDIIEHKHDKTEAAQGETIKVSVDVKNIGGAGNIRLIVKDSEGRSVIYVDSVALQAGETRGWDKNMSMPARNYTTYAEAYHWE